MAKITETTQEKTTPRCKDCATIMIKIEVFSKEVYKCPKCSRSVDGITSHY